MLKPRKGIKRKLFQGEIRVAQSPNPCNADLNPSAHSVRLLGYQ